MRSKLALSASPGVALATAETQPHTVNGAHLAVEYGRGWRVHRSFRKKYRIVSASQLTPAEHTCSIDLISCS